MNEKYALPGQFDWTIPPAPVGETEISDSLSADVIVVGAGYAGTAALRAAAEAGVSVIALEAQKEATYNSLGRELGHINSRFLAERGVPAVDPVEIFNDWQLRNSNRSNPKLIMRFLKNCGENFDWLLEVLTAEEIERVRIKHWPPPRHFTGSVSGMKYWVGTALFTPQCDIPFSMVLRKNQKRACELGAVMEFGTRALYLEKTGSRVTGVIGQTLDGRCKRYRARKGVILTAGDYSKNADMVRSLCTEMADLAAPGEAVTGAGRDGSGIRMGVWAGGRLVPRPHATMGGNYFYPSGVIQNTAVLWLNDEGKRFTNEGFGDMVFASIEGLRTRTKSVTSVFDSNLMEHLQHQSVGHSAVYANDEAEPEALVASLDRARIVTSMEKALAAGEEGLPLTVFGFAGKGSNKTRLFCAPSLEELARLLGFGEDGQCAFVSSVERYNQYSAAGRDEEFGKDPGLLLPLDSPPFYGFSREPFVGNEFLCTVDGLWTDERQNVLDHALEPIPGLYASGNCTGRRWGFQYSTPIAGVSIGMAWTLGREAGREAARSEQR